MGGSQYNINGDIVHTCISSSTWFLPSLYFYLMFVMYQNHQDKFLVWENIRPNKPGSGSDDDFCLVLMWFYRIHQKLCWDDVNIFQYSTLKTILTYTALFSSRYGRSSSVIIIKSCVCCVWGAQGVLPELICSNPTSRQVTVGARSCSSSRRLASLCFRPLPPPQSLTS